MMILGLLLCFGGGWIIQDDVTSRHQLRKVKSGLPKENVEFTFYKVNQFILRTAFHYFMETSLRG